MRRILRRVVATPLFSPKNTVVVTNPSRGASALFESGRIGQQDDDGTEAVGPPDGEGRTAGAAAIPDYSITSMSGSTQERSK
jgi:hypothetical protein